MLHAINAILIESPNPTRLIEFYQRLGLKLEINDHGGGIHAECDFGGVHFAIWKGGQAGISRSNLAFSFHVPQLEEFCLSLGAKGIVLETPPTAKPFGGVVAELRDPDGNRVIFMRWDSDRSRL